MGTVCHQPTHPTPILPGSRQCKWKWRPYAINPPTPPHLESGFLCCWSLGCWIFWLFNLVFLVVALLNSVIVVAETLTIESFGCWIRLFWLLKFGYWIRHFWLLNLILVVKSGWLSCLSVGCWIRFFWLLKAWLLNLSCCIRGGCYNRVYSFANI